MQEQGESVQAGELLAGMTSEARQAVCKNMTPSALRALGEYSGVQAHWATACDCLGSPLILGPNPHSLQVSDDDLSLDWLKYGVVVAASGDHARYEQFRSNALAYFVGTKSTVAMQRVVLFCLFLPVNEHGTPSLACLASACETILLLTSDESYKPWGACSCAIFNYRQGRFDAVAQRTHEALGWDTVGMCRAMNQALLSMASERLNEHQEAIAQFDQACRTLQDESPEELVEHWWDWTSALLIMREASELLEEEPLSLEQMRHWVHKEERPKASFAESGLVNVLWPADREPRSIMIQYFPRNGPLALAESVQIHLGWNGWYQIHSPDAAMLFSSVSNCWEYCALAPTNFFQVDCVFHDGRGTWDNNSHQDWHIGIPKAH